MPTSAIFGLLLGVVQLDGVTGDQLSAEAVFDANNVRLGEPLVLTVDFAGVADLSDLHPPALSRHVDAKIWKVDDASAKTETGRFARRLTYRVRPLREGLQTFPALEFAYEQDRGRGPASFKTLAIPVHVKPGRQAALSVDETPDFESRAMPDGIVIRTAAELEGEEAFAWRKACMEPSEEAFSRFGFPEARLNEAACATLKGNWARALNIYRALEWRIGQTPAVERGIVAALACKTDGQVVELPYWRQALRPVLRYAATGRIVLLAVLLAAVAGFVAACRRLVRALACAALLVLAPASFVLAASPFDEMHLQMQRMLEEMQQTMQSARGGNGGLQMHFSNQGGISQTTRIVVNGNGVTQTIINGEEVPSFEPVLTFRADRTGIRVGEPFEFILAIEHAKGYTIDVSQLRFSEEYGLVAANQLTRLERGAPSNPSNVVDRLSIKARFDVPIRAALSVRIAGTAWRGGFGSGYQVESAPIAFTVDPLPTDNQPDGFAGAVGSDFALRQSVNRNLVATNDVVIVRRTLDYEGIVPDGEGWFRIERRPGSVTWHEYFIADGRHAVPAAEIVYYDVKTRTYKTAKSSPCALAYTVDGDEEATSVAVDAGGQAGAGGAVSRTLRLRFHPSDSAPVVGETSARPAVTEDRGAWARVDDGRRAGWVRKEELQ